MKKEYSYLFKNIFCPIILFILVFLASMYFSIKYNIIELVNNIGLFQVRWEKLPPEIVSITVGIIILIIVLMVFRRTNKDKEFLIGDLYGDFCWLIYILALLLGFKKISLKRKPYRIIFKILLTKKFDIIDNLQEDGEDVNVTYEKKYVKGENDSQYNIIVSDTYPLNFDQIPKLYTIYNTYEFKRIDSPNKRINSKKYMDCVGNVIFKCRSEKRKINLFLTTNIHNTKYLINEYLLIGGRDYINIEIFQQNMNTSKKSFNDKGYKYIRGEKCL